MERALEEVHLEKFKNFKTRELSGGMRRRLSVAISLVGNPKIVFLDEPTTGLDPENRRQLWDILGASRGTRAMVLTTHSMEEADVLCNRIGIVTNGILRCIGTQQHLKNLYGGGYHLFVNCYQEKYLKLLKIRKKSLRLSFKSAQREREEIKQEQEQEQEQEEEEEIKTQKINKHQFTDSELLDQISSLNISRVHTNALEFIRSLLPNARLLQAFNGNFIFEVKREIN